MSTAFKIGEKASVTKTFSEGDVRDFAELSLDNNPLHLDAAYAEGTIFGGQIVHGMLVASLFSALLGTELPGEGSIYLGQTLNFKAPIYLGDTITATVEIIKIRPDKPILTLSTTAVNSDGTLVIDGEAVVKAS
jgi:acyl dehydratase